MPANMTTTPQQAFGITCPDSSQFYSNSKSKFIGCCRDANLAADQACPQDSLDAMTFNPLATNPDDIPAQRCATKDSKTKWYACSSGSSFMGCCASDPCKPGGCQGKDLRAAMISDDPKAASAFYMPDSNTLQIAPSSLAPSNTAASIPTAAPVPSNSSSGDSVGGLPRAAVAGIALGGAAVLLVILMLIYWCVRRNHREEDLKMLRSISMRRRNRYTRGGRDCERDGDASFRAPLTLPKDIQSSMRMTDAADGRHAAVVYGRTDSFGGSEDTVFGTPAPQYTSTMPQRGSMDKSVQHNNLTIVQEAASIASIAADQISLHGSIHPALSTDPPFPPPSRIMPDEPPYGGHQRQRPSESSSIQPLRSQPTFPLYEPAQPSPQYSRHDLHGPPPFTPYRPRQNSNPNVPSPSYAHEEARPSSAPRRFGPVTQIKSPVLPDNMMSPSHVGPLSPHHNLTRELHAKNRSTPLPPPPRASPPASSAGGPARFAGPASSAGPASTSSKAPSIASTVMSRKMPGFRRHRKKDQRLSPLMAPHQKLQLAELPLVRSHSKLGFDPMGIRFSLSGRIKPRRDTAEEEQQRSPQAERRVKMPTHEEEQPRNESPNSLQEPHWEAVNRI